MVFVGRGRGLWALAASALVAAALVAAPTASSGPVSQQSAAGTSAAAATPCGSFGFLKEWGTLGIGDGQHVHPFGIAAERNGKHVYVADPNLNVVVKYTGEGEFVAKWQAFGNGDSFHGPDGVAVGPTNGHVYVTDTLFNRVLEFTRGGTYVRTIGGPGVLLSMHHGLAVGPDGDIYVSDLARNVVVRFTPTGAVRGTIGGPGTGNGQWVDGPHGLGLDGAGNLYTTDLHLGRIQKFDPSGRFIKTWGTIGTEGAGKFTFLHGIAVVPGRNELWVTDLFQSKLEEFTLNGEFIRGLGNDQFGPPSNESGEFFDPEYVAADGRGNIYVSDTLNSRIQKFGVRRC